MLKSKIKFLIKLFSLSLIGAGVGYLVSDPLIWWASIAIRIRPALAGLSWLEAPFSGHFLEWLIYTYQTSIPAALATLFGVVGFVIALAFWLDEWR